MIHLPLGNPDHFDRQGGHEKTPVPQLARAVVSPTGHGPINQARTAVPVASGNRGRGMAEASDRNGDGGFNNWGSIPQLAIEAEPPAGHSPADQEGAAVGVVSISSQGDGIHT